MDIKELFSVEGRIALVTGGSSGIGRHIATGLAAAGAKVYICARSANKIASAARNITSDTGGTLANVNRWRAQLSIPATDEAGLATCTQAPW